MGGWFQSIHRIQNWEVAEVSLSKDDPPFKRNCILQRYTIIKQALVAKTDTKYQLRFVKICKNYYYHWMNGKCKITRGLICRLPRETTGRTPGAYGTAQTKVRKAQKDVNSRCWRGKMHSIDNDDALATQKTSVFYLTLAVDWCLSWAQVMHLTTVKSACTRRQRRILTTGHQPLKINLRLTDIKTAQHSSNCRGRLIITPILQTRTVVKTL